MRWYTGAYMSLCIARIWICIDDIPLCKQYTTHTHTKDMKNCIMTYVVNAYEILS